MEENTLIEDSQEHHQCKICGGKGSTFVYRNDLEELEEIECEGCN